MTAKDELIAAQQKCIEYLEERFYNPMLQANVVIPAEVEHKEKLMLKISLAKDKVEKSKDHE